MTTRTSVFLLGERFGRASSFLLCSLFLSSSCLTVPLSAFEGGDTTEADRTNPSKSSASGSGASGAGVSGSGDSGAAATKAGSQDSDVDRLEKRMATLEAMLRALINRIDATERRLDASELALVEEAKRVVLENKEELAALGRDGAAEADPNLPPGDGGFVMGRTRIKMGGYLKIDTNLTRYSDGAPPSNNAGRDFYIPVTVPVGPDGADTEWATDFNVRESRFNFTTETNVLGEKLKTFLELDFLITPIGDERVSNSSVPRLRHWFLSYKGFTAGQAWSTWMDLPALPEVLDFVGPAEATNFNRQFLIKYKTGGLELAIEQPETTITDPITGARLIPGTDPVPDLIARYRIEEDWGHIQTTGMLRYLTLDPGLSPLATEGDHALGAGASVSGKLNVGEQDDLKFMATIGRGLGRYMALNVVNAATIGNDGTLRTIDTYSAYAAYRHFWTDKWRSTVALGYLYADNPTVLQIGTRESMSLHGNLIYSLDSNWKMGVEYIAARRELESGLSGTINRFQFSTKYSF